MSSHSVDRRIDDRDAHVHSTWDRNHEPVATVEPGSVVRFECLDTLGGQVGPESTVDDLLAADASVVHPLTGPVAVEGLEPGDALVVELLDLEHHGWGFTGVMPGEYDLGLLADEFDEPAYHGWTLADGVGHFVDGVEVPLDPFPGIVGVAPAADGPHETTPPRRVGGNLDVKHLTVGSRLRLPVEVEGGLVSIGDCHAAQGDGEVCGMGVEAPMTVTVRLDREPDAAIDAPQFETDGPFDPAGLAGGGAAHATTGVADDLRVAARDATRAMIDRLVADEGLSRHEAYMLCSVAADLRINEVVNAPNWVVSAYVAEGLID